MTSLHSVVDERDKCLNQTKMELFISAKSANSIFQIQLSRLMECFIGMTHLLNSITSAGYYYLINTPL